MHLVNYKKKPVRPLPGDRISFRKVDSKIRFSNSEGELYFADDAGVNKYNDGIALDASTMCPVDPFPVLHLICCMLGLSYKLVQKTEDILLFELTESSS